MLVGTALLVCAPVAAMVGGLAGFGDPFPISRTGVSLIAAEFAVVNAVCPGERLIEVTLTREGSSTELWRISGDAPLPTQLPIGSSIAGMRTVTELGGTLNLTDPLSIKVITSELDSAYDMDFTLSDVPETGVLSFDNSFTTRDAFTRATLRDTPCGDPYRENGPVRFLRLMLIVALAFAVAGGMMVLLARRQRTGPAI